MLIFLFLFHFFLLPFCLCPSSCHCLTFFDPFQKWPCSSRFSLSCIFVDESQIIIKRGLKGGFCTGGATEMVQLLLKSQYTDSFSYTPHFTASYFSWNSGMSNSLLHIPGHPLLFGAVFQSKMRPLFCGTLFIILKDGFLMPSRTSKRWFLLCFHFHFLKWHWKVQRDTAASVGSVNSCLSSPQCCTAWRRVKLAAVASQHNNVWAGFWPFCKKGKKKQQQKNPHIQDKTVVAEVQMLRDGMQKLSDKRFITANTHTQSTGLDKDIHLFHLMYSSEIWLCMSCFPLAS